MLTYLHAYAPFVQGCPSVMCPSDLSFTDEELWPTPTVRRKGLPRRRTEECTEYVDWKDVVRHWLFFGDRKGGNGYDWSLHRDRALSTSIHMYPVWLHCRIAWDGDVEIYIQIYIRRTMTTFYIPTVSSHGISLILRSIQFSYIIYR